MGRREAAAWFVGLVMVVSLAARPAGAPDVEGRAQAIRALQASVVIKAGQQDDSGRCGGTIVASGTVLTAYHCVRTLVNGSSAALWIETIDGRSSRGTLGQYWVGLDLAIVHAAVEGKIAQLAPDVVVGETVWQVGAPSGENFMVSRGVVSRVKVGKFENETKGLLIGTSQQQIVAVDTVTWQGASGGGLFNQDGQLVGVVVRILVVGWADAKSPDAPLFRQATFGYAVGVATIREALSP